MEYFLGALIIVCTIISVFTRSSTKSTYSLLLVYITMSAIAFHLNASYLSFVLIILGGSNVGVILLFNMVLINHKELAPRNVKQNLSPVFGIILTAILYSIVAMVVEKNIESLTSIKLKPVPFQSIFKSLLLENPFTLQFIAISILVVVIGLSIMVKQEDKRK